MNVTRVGIVAGALTAAFALAAPMASATPPEYKAVDGAKDNWVNEGQLSVEYNNGIKDTDPARVKEALDQCKGQSVSCKATTVGTPEKVTKWFEAGEGGGNPKVVENCRTDDGAKDVDHTVGGMHAFAWSWNIGASVDIPLAKGVGIGIKGEYTETNTDTKTEATKITVKPGYRGTLQLGHDMERTTSDITIQGGKFGGAKITGVRTEALLKDSAGRVRPDIVKCG
ncbi:MULTISPECIES: hypothetical protein [Streptomyces]|uniref:Lipoprotein n=2 Tax=Streptomyces rimosus subsp. rimosus TaxID=132474 RepID=L8EI07_STRR1|nr:MULTISPECIES: hypothetical protein [Streptomyces]KOG76874.1 hypothetical protein ADK78_10115 [Kitasatospora aureofaciens]MYT45344.1 hypothetical protein [Streptomyces sp. SID5471]KEF07313.1 hypothetical protein DF17_10450 [Streptomyces rimosus]KEF19642.1 hypothetical protein DF18_16335 [Streptomyces rimosus]KOT27826.1 hypothetical protein ADK42_35285 [Streptomyces rimosus subsp. rimosus]